MSDQLTFFNLKEFESVRSNPVYDPYWDELEKDLGVTFDQSSVNTDILPCESVPPHASVGAQIFSPGVDQDAYVGEQIFCPGAAECPYSSVGEQVLIDTKKTAHQHDAQRRDQDAYVGEQIFCRGAADSPYSSVGEQVSTNTKKTAHQHDTQTTHWVEKYWVARGNNKYWYYRYTWMEGRKMRRLYIGSVNSALVRRKVELIFDAIGCEKSPFEIKQLVANYNIDHHCVRARRLETEREFFLET